MGSASVHRCRLLLRSHVLLQALAGAAAFVGPLGPAPRAPPRAPALRGSGLRVPGCAAAGARRARVASGVAGLAAQIKFADAVEEILVRKWDKKAVSRVVKSWRRMDEDYIHKQFWDEHDTWQECNSYVEGLPCKTFHDAYAYEWAQQLRDKAAVIQDEFKRVAIEGSDDLDKKGNNVWATAANATSAQSYGPDWKTLALMDRCVWDPINVNLFPETTKILRELEVPCLEAFFARMQPKSKISAHSDYCNFALTAHLGLVIPEKECWIKVGKDSREWRNGEMLMFDTSLLHEAANEAESVRYILMLRVWHPDLSPQEVEAIKYIFACLDEPEAVEHDLRRLAPALLEPATAAAAPASAKPASSFNFGPMEGGPAGGPNRADRRAAKKKKAKPKGGGGGFG